MRYLLQKIFVCLGLVCAIGCGHSEFITTPHENPSPDVNGDRQPYAAFPLGSDFPADIDIPDIDGMRNTAFIVSTSSPAGVIAVDLDARPIKLSDRFSGLISPLSSGIPNSLIITSTEEAFLLTSTSIISFNPTSGRVAHVASALEPITIGPGRMTSRGITASQTITPSFPGGIAVIGRRLYISTANYIRTALPAIANPGTIQSFDITADHSLSRSGHMVTSCYNPTALTVRSNHELLVTNSGVLDIANAAGQPQTTSCIDIIAIPEFSLTASLSLGMAAASFHPIALTFDRSRGFVGSAAAGELYEIDFMNRKVLHAADNPIVLTTKGDYITDVALSVDNATLFAASFEQSAVIPTDISIIPPAISTQLLVVGSPAGATDDNPTGANTGAGPIAVRPGTRGKDYEGEDLMVLTGYPGQLIVLDSGSAGVAPTLVAEPEDLPSAPPLPPTGSPGTACQGFAQAVTEFHPGDNAGFGEAHLPNIVLGPPRGRGELMGSTDVVSLGIDGEIIIDVGNCRMVDGPGNDFIIFENPFLIGGIPGAPYRELGTVGVSNDGIHFSEFGCEDKGYPYTGCAGWNPVLSNADNGISPFDVVVAGGDPFDLAEIGVSEVRYIRIHDTDNTSLGGNSAGFDLDAIAVVNGIIR